LHTRIDVVKRIGLSPTIHHRQVRLGCFTFAMSSRATDVLDQMAQGAQRHKADELLDVLLIIVLPPLMALDRPLVAPATAHLAATGCNSEDRLPNSIPIDPVQVLLQIRAPTTLWNKFDSELRPAKSVRDCVADLPCTSARSDSRK
jgi:hypothetical protein